MEKGRVVPLLYNLEPVQSDIIRTDKKKGKPNPISKQ